MFFFNYYYVFFQWRSPLSGEFAFLSFRKLYVHIHENNLKFEWNSVLVKLIRVRHRYRRGAELNKQSICPCVEPNKSKLEIYVIMYIKPHSDKIYYWPAKIYFWPYSVDWLDTSYVWRMLGSNLEFCLFSFGLGLRYPTHTPIAPSAPFE